MTRHTGGAGLWNPRQPDKHQHLQRVTKTYVGLSTGGNDSFEALSFDKNPLVVQPLARGSWSTSHTNLVPLYLQAYDSLTCVSQCARHGFELLNFFLKGGNIFGVNALAPIL